jgi:hypothetical protein
MKTKITKLIRKLFDKLVPYSNFMLDNLILDEEFGDLYKKVKNFSTTSKLGLYSLYKSTKYISDKKIQGCIVECGVWKGGGVLLILETLLKNNDIRDIYLYDTFEGMTEPSQEDFSIPHKTPAYTRWQKDKFKGWGIGSYDFVYNLLSATKYPIEKIHFVVGDINQTLKEKVPTSEIALLKLDTDWYNSTLLELSILYPKLLLGGILIIDDYGYWAGSKKAVDEYFKNNPILLNRIDHTGRIIIKQ